MSYGDTHRRFLKNLMASNNLVAQNKAVDLYCKCRDHGSNDEVSQGANAERAIAKFIDQINQKLYPLNMTIKLVTCEATNKKFYTLHTMNENELTKLVAGKQWGRNERAVLKTVIKAIVKSPAGRVSVATCARECAELPEKIKRPEFTKILQKLVLENWLIEITDQVYVGPRAMVEMKKYLIEEFEEQAVNCSLCKELTLRGLPCPSSCGVKVHQVCLTAYFSKAANRKCIGCKKPWPETANNQAQAAPSQAMEVEDDSSSDSDMER